MDNNGDLLSIVEDAMLLRLDWNSNIKWVVIMPFLVDIFHTNTIEIINRSINGLCKKGDLLIAVRNLNLIGIIDVENEDLIWSWGREF